MTDPVIPADEARGPSLLDRLRELFKTREGRDAAAQLLAESAPPTAAPSAVEPPAPAAVADPESVRAQLLAAWATGNPDVYEAELRRLTGAPAGV